MGLQGDVQRCRLMGLHGDVQRCRLKGLHGDVQRGALVLRHGALQGGDLVLGLADQLVSCILYIPAKLCAVQLWHYCNSWRHLCG